jgi:hypothetical protein
MAIHRNQVIADMVAAVAHVRKTSLEKIHVVAGRAVEGVSMCIGCIGGIERAQQCAVLAIDAT